MEGADACVEVAAACFGLLGVAIACVEDVAACFGFLGGATACVDRFEGATCLLVIVVDSLGLFVATANSCGCRCLLRLVVWLSLPC